MLNSVTYCHVFNVEQVLPEHCFPGLLEELLLFLLEARSPHLSLVSATRATRRHAHVLLQKSLTKWSFGIKAGLLQPCLERASLSVCASRLLHVAELLIEVEEGLESRTQDSVFLLEHSKLLV